MNTTDNTAPVKLHTAPYNLMQKCPLVLQSRNSAGKLVAEHLDWLTLEQAAAILHETVKLTAAKQPLDLGASVTLSQLGISNARYATISGIDFQQAKTMLDNYKPVDGVLMHWAIPDLHGKNLFLYSNSVKGHRVMMRVDWLTLAEARALLAGEAEEDSPVEEDGNGSLLAYITGLSTIFINVPVAYSLARRILIAAKPDAVEDDNEDNDIVLNAYQYPSGN